MDAEFVLEQVRGILTVDCFEIPHYKAIYAAAIALVDQGRSPDPVMIRDEARHMGCELDAALIRELLTIAPTAANVVVHAEAMVKDANARAMATLLGDVIARLSDGEDVDSVRGDIESQLAKCRQRGDSDVVSGADAIDATYRLLEEMSAGQKLFVPTGFRNLDNILGGGLIKSGLHILAARPGTGKTTLALQIAENVAAAGKRVLFVSLEMSREQLTQMRFAIEGGIDRRDLLSITDKDADLWRRVTEVAARIHSRPLYFNRLSNLSVSRIERLARSSKAELVVIDYLGLISHGNGKSLYEKVTETSGALKRMAMALNVPVLCLCQLNRESDGRAPKVSELRDSGAIEQDADTITMQWIPGGRPEVDNSWTPAELEVIVGKNRHGPLGKLRFAWYMACGRIRE